MSHFGENVFTCLLNDILILTVVKSKGPFSPKDGSPKTIKVEIMLQELLQFLFQVVSGMIWHLLTLQVNQ